MGAAARSARGSHTDDPRLSLSMLQIGVDQATKIKLGD
jgi:hypothetical protein